MLIKFRNYLIVSLVIFVRTFCDRTLFWTILISENNSNAQNDWHGAWWHSSLTVHSGKTIRLFFLSLLGLFMGSKTHNVRRPSSENWELEIARFHLLNVPFFPQLLATMWINKLAMSFRYHLDLASHQYIFVSLFVTI